MSLQSEFAHNKNVRIHYLDSRGTADPSLTPLIICPGLSETAEEYEELIADLSPRRCVVLSFRGRGLSDTPSEGYTLEHHISDVECVVDELGLERLHLFGYSRGVSYALGYAAKHSGRIASLIMLDYPAVHKLMPPGWADEYINDYLIPFGRTTHIRPEAARAIEAESADVALDAAWSCPVLVMRGLLEDSLLSDADLSVYQRCCSRLTMYSSPQAGHNIRGADQQEVHDRIVKFLQAADSSGTTT